MELTRRVDYAFRILQAAYRCEDGYVSVSDIAEREDVPYAFARSIQHELVKAGFLKTSRGARGGLALAVDPAEVTLLDLLCALGQGEWLSPCITDPDVCERSCACKFNRVWRGADRLLRSYFSELSLFEIFEGDFEGEFAERALARACLAASEPDVDGSVR